MRQIDALSSGLLGVPHELRPVVQLQASAADNWIDATPYTGVVIVLMS